jgi:hypothetical protein
MLSDIKEVLKEVALFNAWNEDEVLQVGLQGLSSVLYNR